MNNLQIKNKKIKILIVEPEYKLRYLMKHIFNSFGYQTMPVNNNVEALNVLTDERFKKEHYNLVIVDQHKLKQKGIELIRHIHNQHADSILIGICDSDPEVHEKTRDAGVLEILEKPFAMHKLLGVVEQLFDTKLLPSNQGAANDSC